LAIAVPLSRSTSRIRRGSAFFVRPLRTTMKPIRYIVGAIGFLLVWLVVAVVVGFIVTFFIPPTDGHIVRLGIGMDWRNLPGTILGLFAGIQSFRASVREPRKRDDK